MENLKDRLLEKVNKSIEEKKEELNNLKEELEVLKAEIKVEEELLKMKDIPDEVKEDRKYLVQVMKDEKMMREEKIEEIKKDLQGLNLKKKVLKGLTEHDLKE